ncbi:hypothetical protein AgCh_020135 [Apium graveolens]
MWIDDGVSGRVNEILTEIIKPKEEFCGRKIEDPCGVAAGGVPLGGIKERLPTDDLQRLPTDNQQGSRRMIKNKLLKYKECKDHNNQQDEKKDVGVKISFLDKDNYHHWKVKMHLYLLSQDEAYVDCIERGPHVSMRAATGNEPSVPKPRHEWSDPDIEQVRKDKKAMNILFNGVDGDMFDNIINCKTTKEVWDTIQIFCDGTEQVRENKIQLLIQQYEHFHCKESESLTDIFSRFQNLMNALKLHGRVYQTKDSNLKFLTSLPKE